MNVHLSAIERDSTIQCRATIDVATVNEYAERMTEGDEFPPVVLFATNGKHWIGDGWHRLLAAEHIGALTISAEVRDGGRVEALKYALGANAAHGHRRSNADKRRCVEVALQEFSKLSSRAIAEMCGVSHGFVDQARPALATVANATVTTKDGRQYPATRAPANQTDNGPPTRSAPVEAIVPCRGMQLARLAIMQLEQIRSDDAERALAFTTIRRWLDEHKN